MERVNKELEQAIYQHLIDLTLENPTYSLKLTENHYKEKVFTLQSPTNIVSERVLSYLTYVMSIFLQQYEWNLWWNKEVLRIEIIISPRL